MRTTITMPDDLIKRTLAASGKRRLSDALVQTLEEHFALKQRLALLDELFENPVPHDWKRIKKERKGRKWS